MIERKVSLYDIDKTSYKDFLLLDLVRYQFKKGILPESTFSAIERDINLYTEKVLIYQEMAHNVLGYWPKGLKGKRLEDVANNAKEFFSTEGRKFFNFVQESIDLLNPTHDTYFITAQPQFVAEEVTRMHQATGYFSTIFEVKDGIFTGNISSTLATKEDKGKKTKEIMQNHDKAQSFAFGDSDNDIEMLEGVEYPICVNPNDELKTTAAERGWSIKKPEEIVIYIREMLTKPKS